MDSKQLTLVFTSHNWNVQSVVMQIHADSKGKVALDDITLARRQSRNTQASEAVSQVVDLLNPKSIGFDRLSMTILLCQVSSHSDPGFSFYRANVHTHTPTNIHRGRVIAISAPPYYVVGADSYPASNWSCRDGATCNACLASVWTEGCSYGSGRAALTMLKFSSHLV